MNSSAQLRILFFLIKSRLNSKGEAPLFCKITLNKSNSRFSIGISISPKIWSQVKQQAIGKSDLAKNVNLKIESITKKIREIEAYFMISQQAYGVQDVINKLLNRDNKTIPFKTLMQAYKYRYNQMEKLLGKSYAEGTLVKAQQLQNIIEGYLNKELKLKDVALNKVDTHFLVEFEHYLKAEKTFLLPPLIKQFRS